MSDPCKSGAWLCGHMCGGTDVLQICIDILIIGRKQCGALIVENGQAGLASPCVGIGQVVKAVG